MRSPGEVPLRRDGIHAEPPPDDGIDKFTDRYESERHGAAEWTRMNEGFESPEVSILAFDAADELVCIGLSSVADLDQKRKCAAFNVPLPEK